MKVRSALIIRKRRTDGHVWHVLASVALCGMPRNVGEHSPHKDRRRTIFFGFAHGSEVANQIDSNGSVVLFPVCSGCFIFDSSWQTHDWTGFDAVENPPPGNLWLQPARPGIDALKPLILRMP